MSTDPVGLAPVQGFSNTWVTPLLRRWWLIVVLGIGLAVLGVVLIVSPFHAARVLAVVTAIGMAFIGVDELAQAERHDVKWPSYVLGAIWLIGSLLALLWPKVTLWALAALVGVTFIAGGIAALAFVFRYRRELPMWGLWWLDGLCSIAFGVFALVWPRATVVVLGVVLGLRVLLRGVATVTFGLSLRRLHATTSPQVPT